MSKRNARQQWLALANTVILVCMTKVAYMSQCLSSVAASQTLLRIYIEPDKRI